MKDYTARKTESYKEGKMADIDNFDKNLKGKIKKPKVIMVVPKVKVGY